MGNFVKTTKIYHTKTALLTASSNEGAKHDKDLTLSDEGRARGGGEGVLSFSVRPILLTFDSHYMCTCSTSRELRTISYLVQVPHM